MQGHLLDIAGQQNGHSVDQVSSVVKLGGGSLLSNRHLQETPQLFAAIYQAAPVTERLPKIEALKKRHFTQEGRAARIARSLEALAQPNPTQLSREEWIWVAELVDPEDEYE